MQQAYTGFFSGPESIALPLEVKAQKEEFEKAFLQMQTLATKLAEYQHKIGKALAEQKPVVAAENGVVGSSGSSTGPAVLGAAPVAWDNRSEGPPTVATAEGGQSVEQNPLQTTYAAVVAATRTTSPDPGAGGQSGCTTTSSLQESKTQKEKRAEGCTDE